MDHFPKDFLAEKVQLDVYKNKTQKFKADLKALRRLIVDAFSDDEIGHVTYDFTSNCTREDMKMAYKQIKVELEKRGFKVHGRIDEPRIELLIASRHLSKTNQKWSAFASGTASNTRSSSPSPSSSSAIFDDLESVKEPVKARRKSSIVQPPIPVLSFKGVQVMTPTGSRPASTEDHKELDSSSSALMDPETSHREGSVDHEDISSLFDKSISLELIKRQAVTSATKNKKNKKKKGGGKT